MANPAPGFDLSTRTHFGPIGTATRSSGGQSRIDIPQTGYMARLYCTVRGVINVVTSGPNALGQAAIIRQIRLLTGASIDLINISGPGYFHLLKPVIDAPINVIPYSTALSAIASAGTVKLDFVLPVEVNLRDQIGYFTMQNRQTLATLVVDWETDANIATGGITWTTQPVLTVNYQWMTVPSDAANQPALNTVHTINEDQTTIAAAGQSTYNWPLGNTYLQLIHGFGFAVAGADNWSRLQWVANQSDYLMDVDPNFMDLQHGYQRGLTRAPGVVPLDLIGQSGQGVYDIPRDTINSQALTNLKSVFTFTASGTLYSVRREVVNIGRPA